MMFLAPKAENKRRKSLNLEAPSSSIHIDPFFLHGVCIFESSLSSYSLNKV